MPVRLVLFYLAGILGAVMLVSAVAPARAHDWYDGDCCSSRDCRPIPSSEVRELAWDRILDLVTGMEVRGGQVRQSKDGGWHICNVAGNRKQRPICIYRPTPAF